MGGHSGITGELFNNSNNAQNLSNQYSSQALGIQSALTPQLTAEAENPQGYNPTTMGQMTTAAEQTAGGSNSGIAGSAGLRAARTRNIGSGQATTEAAGQSAGQGLSQINAGIQNKNADLKAKQQQAGLSGLEGTNSEDMSAGENALGLSNSSLADAGKLPNYWQHLLDENVQGTYDVASSAASNGQKCFITTACIRAKGLADDCEELTALRWFRDNVMKSNADGRAAVQEYYKIAPEIVTEIESKPNADSIFDDLFSKLVKPCVELIKGKRYKEAEELYTDTVNYLKREYIQQQVGS